ncbi:MAG: alpha-glucosidase [Chloroflexota bacterium]|nr:alpha-glucosidase [Chloroflexota bacterium]
MRKQRETPSKNAVSALVWDTYQVGSFILFLAYCDQSGPALRVVHQSEPERVLWESIPHAGFLCAARGRARIRENVAPFSGFEIHDKILALCDRQSVESIQAGASSLTLWGTLSNTREVVGYSMTLTAVAEHQLQFQIQLEGPNAAAFNRIFLRSASSKEEQFFGFGQQLTFFNQKGKTLPILVQEHGLGRGLPIIADVLNLVYPGITGSWYTTAVSIPHYISSQRRSVFLENTEYSIFDMSQDDRIEIKLFASVMTGRILHGATPLELIEQYSAYAGRMRPLPEWVHEGVIVGVQGGTAVALRKLEALTVADVPVSAFWIQDWVGQRQTSAGIQLWWNWQLDETLYPRWDELVKTLADQRSARVLLYVNPFLTNSQDHDQLFQEAKRAGYLVKTQSGDPYLFKNVDFAAGLLDLSNPHTRQWIKQIITDKLIKRLGASGWMADFGEALAFDAALYSGESPDQWHNRYPEEWARISREGIEESGHGDDFMFFSRSGYTRSPGISTLFWLHDQLQTWDEFDGMKTTVIGALSGSLSGFTLVHSDTGGFGSISVALPGGKRIPVISRSKELLLRWMELNAFTPVFRTHEGVDPLNTIQYDSDPEIFAHLKRFAKVYKAWGFYRKELVAEAARTGHPVMRHPFLHYPDDPLTYSLRYQFLLGTELMVAPVLDQGADHVRVYLPAGRWTHLWTGETVGSADGMWKEIWAPLGKPAVFYKQDSGVGSQFLVALKAEGIDPDASPLRGL